MNKIEVSHLRKSFAKHPVLDGISFKAKPGEVVALLGDSGAGKSTLLRCLNLLDQPDGGRMTVNGLSFEFSDSPKKIPRQKLLALRGQVGMVFQQYHLWAHLTILQNLIEAPLQVLKLSRSQAIERANYLLNEMGILSKKDSHPTQLSGGQQQRVAIARALMMEPQIMLFDEPTSALDPQRMASVMKLINELVEKGMTVVIATHEIKVAQELAQQTIFLREGKICEQGHTKVLLHSPKTEAFQQFIGDGAY